MNINYKYIDELIVKCLHQQASAMERKALLNALKYSDDPILNEKIIAAFNVSQVQHTPTEAVWEKLAPRNSRKYKETAVRPLFLLILRYAAAVALLLSLPLYLYKQEQKLPITRATVKQELVALSYTAGLTKDALASEQIQLELANGQILDLTAEDSTRIVTQDKLFTVVKEGDKIQYLASSGYENQMESIIYHRIKVPFGKRIRIQLSDGTQIELNSGSELKYPVGANQQQMDLYLKGEGYFDVAQVSKRLFNVHVDGYGKRKDYNVQVLGTQFNIKSFPEDNSSKTSLFSGSIQLTGLDKSSFQLQPMMELEVEKSYSVKAADIEAALAWRKGDFFFKNASLYEVCMELGRWYGVDFQYDKSLENMQFYFNVSRSKSLDHVLKMLAKHENIKISKNNQCIKITRK